MRYCGIFCAVSRRFLSFPAVLQFFKTKWLSFFYQFGKFRCAICGILLFFRAVLPFSEPPPPLTPHYIMEDTAAFIDVLNEEDYETREHCNEDSHLLIEEPSERSQKV